MKQLTLAAILATFSAGALTAQNSNPWPTTGNVGIGTTTGNFHLQLHGTTDYTTPSIPAIYDINGNLVQPAQPGVNMGKTSRLGLTNSTCGATSTDGLLVRMSGNNGTIENLEKQDLTLSSNGSTMRFSGSSNRVWTGTGSLGSLTASTYGYFNVVGADNGLYIQNTATGKFGISIRSFALTDNAIQVMGTTGTTRNFAVKANGEVFARKYTTTLAAIPDYVFEPSYKLMDFAQLRQYIQLNHHLPNVPSAKEYETNGVDLGEMNRVLLEKVEELTLYILQLEERLNAVEKQQE